jgi:hypothetical protein
VAADEWGQVVLLHFTVTNGSSTTTTTIANSFTSTITGQQGYATVTGDVSVGPAYPVCQVGKYCNVNMTGYAIEFTGKNASSTTTNTLTYNGSFSVELNPDTYLVNLLSCKGTVFPTDCTPSCPWLGCSAFYLNNKNEESFPFSISVSAGENYTLNININTGIA